MIPDRVESLLMARIMEELEIHAEVAHTSSPMDDALGRVRSRMGDPVDPPEGVRYWEELEAAVQHAKRTAKAMKTVRENQRVPWPVPEELERPGWDIQEVASSNPSVVVTHMESLPRLATLREVYGILEADPEEEVVRPWLAMDLEIQRVGGRTYRRLIRFGWSVRSRRIFVWWRT